MRLHTGLQLRRPLLHRWAVHAALQRKVCRHKVWQWHEGALAPGHRNVVQRLCAVQRTNLLLQRSQLQHSRRSTRSRLSRRLLAIICAGCRAGGALLGRTQHTAVPTGAAC